MQKNLLIKAVVIPLLSAESFNTEKKLQFVLL